MLTELPLKQWLTAKECAAWLEMDCRQFRLYIGDGLFPEGILRGSKLRVWSREDLATMVYLEKNKSRFTVKKLEDRVENEADEDEI